MSALNYGDGIASPVRAANGDELHVGAEILTDQGPARIDGIGYDGASPYVSLTFTTGELAGYDELYWVTISDDVLEAEDVASLAATMELAGVVFDRILEGDSLRGDNELRAAFRHSTSRRFGRGFRHTITASPATITRLRNSLKWLLEAEESAAAYGDGANRSLISGLRKVVA